MILFETCFKHTPRILYKKPFKKTQCSSLKLCFIIFYRNPNSIIVIFYSIIIITYPPFLINFPFIVKFIIYYTLFIAKCKK